MIILPKNYSLDELEVGKLYLDNRSKFAVCESYLFKINSSRIYMLVVYPDKTRLLYENTSPITWWKNMYSHITLDL